MNGEKTGLWRSGLPTRDKAKRRIVSMGGIVPNDRLIDKPLKRSYMAILSLPNRGMDGRMMRYPPRKGA